MSGAAPPGLPASEPSPSIAPISGDLMPGRPFRSGLSSGTDPGHWHEEDLAAHPAEDPPQALGSEQVQARLKVASWQRHTQEPAPHPNGAPPAGPTLSSLNGASAAPDGGGLSNGTGVHESSPSTADTSPPSTLAASSPQHHAADLRLTDHTRRLASVRTVGVRAARPPEVVTAALADCERALAAAHVREAELQRETRVLAARLAHLRMAHEVQAGKLAEAAGRAVAARREVVAENVALASALAAAQHSAAVYAQQLLPLLAHHGLTPPPADPPAVAAAVASLVDRLATEVNLLQKVVAGGGPVLEQRLQAAVRDAATVPAPSAHAPAPPPPLQDVRGSADSSLSLATGIGPAPSVSQGPPAGSPLFPGGTWSPLPPGVAPPSQAAAQPSPPSAEPRSPPASAAPPGRAPGEEAIPGQWSPGASGVPERPTSVRFRPAQDSPGAGASLVKRSASWRGQDSAAAVRFREGAAPLRDSALDGTGQTGLGRGGGGGAWGPTLRDSQRNLLDSVASPQRGLGASHDPSTWQMSSLAEVQDADGAAEGACDDDDSGAQQQQQQQLDGEQDDDPLPAILNLKIAGEAVLGGKLTACGHSVYGSSLCYFQWVRHKQDGAAYLIEGAKQPEYLVSADDARCQITVECLPVDDRGRKGEVVNAAANNGEPIPIDEVTSNLLTGYAASGKARFTVLDAHNGVEHELCIDRRSLSIKRGSHGVIKEPYSGEVQAEIAVNEATVVLIHISGGRRMDLDCIDNRARDLAVLTLRHFVDAHLQYQDEKTRRRGFFSRR